jgi:hypothetical protein
MNMNARSPSTLRRHPGFIRDHDWTINGPAIGPEQTPRWPSDPDAPSERRHNDIEWPVEDRRVPRVPVPTPPQDEDDAFPWISPTQPATCWLI